MNFSPKLNNKYVSLVDSTQLKNITFTSKMLIALTYALLCCTKDLSSR